MSNYNDSVMRDYIRSSLKNCNRTNEELIEDHRAGDSSAKEKLVLKNYGLIKKLAFQFDMKTSSEICIEDLIQEGQIGLIESIDKYDPEMIQSAQFHTYAFYWIKQKMIRYMREKSKLIKIPSNQFDEYNKLSRGQRQLEVELQRNPTLIELSKMVGKTTEEITHLRSLFSSIDSIDQPINNDTEDITLGDMIRDPADHFDNIEHIAYIDWLRNEFDYAFKRYLTLQESEILKARYGLDSFKPMQYNEIGDMLEMDSNKVIDVVWRSLNKLRSSGWYLKLEASYRYEDKLALKLSETYEAVEKSYSAG